jgi:predicted phosphoadenosine phosphosulfate sulfurtransferase
MSSKYWRTAKPIEQFNPGKCATERVSAYVQTWRRRCYSADIPDEVPNKVAASGRAPSWKSVAICILQNDLHFYGLGFSSPSWEHQRSVIAKGRPAVSGAYPENHQLELF